jgi:hypothetical protein
LSGTILAGPQYAWFHRRRKSQKDLSMLLLFNAVGEENVAGISACCGSKLASKKELPCPSACRSTHVGW